MNVSIPSRDCRDHTMNISFHGCDFPDHTHAVRSREYRTRVRQSVIARVTVIEVITASMRPHTPAARPRALPRVRATAWIVSRGRNLPSHGRRARYRAHARGAAPVIRRVTA